MKWGIVAMVLLLAAIGIVSKGSCRRPCRAVPPAKGVLKAAEDTCVNGTVGLQDIVDGLRAAGCGRRGRRHHNGSKRKKDLATLLVTTGHPTLGADLRECMAVELGLTFDNGTININMTAVTEGITSRVTDATVTATTAAGLAACLDVVEFNLYEYYKCVRDYCTGRLP